MGTKGSLTSSFGVAGRHNHDSSVFYDTRMYEGKKPRAKVEFYENPVPPENLDQVFCHDSKNMHHLPEGSVHLCVTSPPYNASKEYDQNLTIKEYRRLLTDVFTDVYRVLVPGGRLCVNVANLGRKPYIPVHTFIIEDLLKIGYLMRGEVIWNKSASAGSSTAWGSWKSPSNPTLRDVHEYIMIFCKESFGRKPPEKREATIKRDDFLAWTKSVWDFPTESARRVGHPAPFPLELPRRFIHLYTYQGEVVLDPFCGSGTTCAAAKMSDRHYVGYDLKEKYVEIAQKRVELVKAGQDL